MSCFCIFVDFPIDAYRSQFGDDAAAGIISHLGEKGRGHEESVLKYGGKSVSGTLYFY